MNNQRRLCNRRKAKQQMKPFVHHGPGERRLCAGATRKEKRFRLLGFARSLSRLLFLVLLFGSIICQWLYRLSADSIST